MLFLLPSLVELIMTETPLWRYRRTLSYIVIGLLLLSGPAAFLLWPGVISCLLVAINAYRLVNLGRILEDRMHDTYLHAQVRRTSRWLVAAVAIGYGLQHFEWLMAANNTLLIVTTAALVASIITGLSAWRQLATSRTGPVTMMSSGMLPTLTVAIPARDEGADLAACLASVIASDYPKLEILVLDDHSTDKKTAEIIRGFAHAGVRFLPGEPARRNWLAKNLAYQSLARQANGELIVFCGVDIQFQPDSLRQLVNQMVVRQKQMVSVVPLNVGPYNTVQAMRYAWELALPRRLFNRPAVLSSCWIIKRDSLKRVGGFAAVTRMVVPEAYFARQLMRADGYGLLRSGRQLGITSDKSTSEQTATALRTRYPQLHKRIELTALTSIVLLAVFAFIPFRLAISLYRGQWLASALGFAALLITSATFYALLRASYRRVDAKAALGLTVASAWDAYLLNLSMWRYEFGKVLWKGRDVTPSVMHKTPHLPKL